MNRKRIATVGIFLGIIFLPLAVFADDTDWNDDFESYSVGDLNAQGLWVDGGTTWKVGSSVVNSGTRAVYNSDSGSYNARKDTSYVITGDGHIFSGYVRTTNSSVGAWYDLYETGTGPVCTLYKNAYSASRFDLVGAGPNEIVATTASNQWDFFEIEFNDTALFLGKALAGAEENFKGSGSVYAYECGRLDGEWCYKIKMQ